MTDKMEEFVVQWLETKKPSALVGKEHLIPVEGKTSIIFPPTFAPGEGEKVIKEIPPYVFDTLPDGRTICLIDTVESQANRMEALFMREELAELVPQIILRAGEKEANLLEIGHRAADALVRYSELYDELNQAFRSYQEQGNALDMAKIAPTSLVFGAWDSRETQAKIPRLLRSEIRAFNVDLVHRAMQYKAPIPYKEFFPELSELLEKKIEDKTVGSKYGFYDVPSGITWGGIVLRPGGWIERLSSINLVIIRNLLGTDPESTRKLQRYILGLALVAFVTPQDYYLRQGCLLCRDPSAPPVYEEVYGNGTRNLIELNEKDVLEFAKKAAKEFGVEKGRKVQFLQDKIRARIEKELRKRKQG